MKEIYFQNMVKEQDFVDIATILTKSLEWKLVQRIDIDASVWMFQKDDVELLLIYDDMAGIFLKTNIETYPLDVLKNEIDTMIRKQ
jgi:hypothetical protein